jgi:hypothetical protein
MTATDMVLHLPQQVQGSININHLGDTYTVRFTKSEQDGIVIELHNRELHFSRELAALKDGRWSYITEERFQELWTIMKSHKKVHSMFKRFIRMDIYASVNKQISCGRRRFNIAVTRMFYKLTK